jgi:NADH dehydrogenase
LIHVSALGLHQGARSGFITSKLAGERAIAASGARYTIVRPSLLDGEGGYGARWLRWFARWPVHFVPAEARGRIAVMAVTDLGEAVAGLCEREPAEREIELGGTSAPTMAEYLAALRGRPPIRISVASCIARIVSHLCDWAHFSPFSFGHLELLRRDNVPCPNALPQLLGREPLAVLGRGEVVDLAPVALRRPAL